MDAETQRVVISSVLGPLLVAAVALRGTRHAQKGRRASERAADAAVSAQASADVAVELSRPTGNGFAEMMRRELTAIRAEAAVDRAEFRAEVRAVHNRVDAVHRRLTSHTATDERQSA